MHGSPITVRPVRGFSLGAKFVGLTAALILLLSLTAFISLRNSNETAGQLKAVVDFAIPAYRAIARSHIRSLEQAVELRRSLLLVEDPTVPLEAIAKRMQAFRAARMQFDRDFADAEQLLLEEQWLNRTSGSSAFALRDLREQLAQLKLLTETYANETDACLAAIASRLLPEAKRRLVTVDGLRQELDQRLEAMRAGMADVLNAISREAEAAHSRAEKVAIIVFVLSSILGLGIAALGAVRLVRSIQSIVHGAEAVEGGNLETRIPIPSRDEIGRLADSFNRMTEGLRLRERIRDTFGKYVDRRIARELIESQGSLVERGDRREVAVMFCDLAGFTALSERVAAEQLVQFLNAYFSLMAREIAATDGVIDKYIGDAVMAYWCPPFVPKEEVALRSAEAAARCLDQIPAIAAASRDIFDPRPESFDPRIRIGIATGQSITGSIGAEERRNYTVIGDTVNLAARIEAANRLYRTANLVCGRTAAAIGATFVLREVDAVLLPGIEGPQAIFEILGRAGQVPAETAELRARYEVALGAYRRGDWPAARRHLEDCLAISPDDGPAWTMLARIEALAGTPRRDDWNGIWPLRKDDLP